MGSCTKFGEDVQPEEARAAVHVVCNTKRETLGDIIKRALCNTPVVGALVSFIPDFC